jgi:hypothetical protein
MSDLVALAQEIAKGQKDLEQIERDITHFSKVVDRKLEEKANILFNLRGLKTSLRTLCGEPEPVPGAAAGGAAAPIAAARGAAAPIAAAGDAAAPIAAAGDAAAPGTESTETLRKRSRSPEPRNREKTIAYDSVDGPVADKKAGQSSQKRGKTGTGKAAEKPVKPPLDPKTAKAVEKLLEHINRKKSSSSEKTEDEEDFDYHEDECGMSASEQKKPCWNEKSGWHNHVLERFKAWREHNYPFLFLSLLPQIRQDGLKTCTLGHFITVAHNVDHWHIPSVTSNLEWSRRLAEHLE